MATEAQFVAAVSHEIRTPMHAITGLTELLNESELNADQSKLVRAIAREAAALNRTINDVLDYSKMAAGSMELFPAAFSPGRLTAEVAESLRPRAESLGLRLFAHIDPAAPRQVDGDEFRIRQILVNLAGNALKYTPEGEVAMHLAPDASGAGVVFSVVDTGVGIPPEAIGDLFRPFSQAHGSSAARKGTGMGLAICQQLVQIMGGSIDVESVEGQGTTFRIALPLEAVDEAVQAAAAPVEALDASPVAPGARILVVEDSAANQMLASAQLARLGHESTIADCGERALEVLVDQTFDAVLMDWHMPGIDGLETTRRYRQSELATSGRRLPIIAMTANAMAGDREVCIEAGMDDYMSKPVSMADLAHVLDRWLRVESTSDSGGAASGEGDGVGAGSTVAVVDVAVLDQLAADIGDPTIVGVLIETFLDELPARLRQIEQADDEAARAAHTLKSTAATVGAVELADASAALEAHLRMAIGDGEASGEPVLTDRLVKRLTALAEQSAQFFRTYLESIKTTESIT